MPAGRALSEVWPTGGFVGLPKPYGSAGGMHGPVGNILFNLVNAKSTRTVGQPYTQEYNPAPRTVVDLDNLDERGWTTKWYRQKMVLLLNDGWKFRELVDED